MKIGELAARSGTTGKTARIYEQAGLLLDPDQTGTQRLPGLQSHVAECLSFIRRSHLSPREVRQILAIHGYSA